MRRFLLALSITTISLAACAPRPQIIQGGVAGTLTALAPTPVLPADRPTSTPVPTVLPPPATPEPSPTVEPTSTEGPTPTDTPITIILGELIFEDTFGAPGGWAVGDTADSNVAVSGGVLSYTQKNPGSFSFRVIGKQGGDFTAEISTALADNCGSGDRFGLIFRLQDADNYYAFQIDCDGRYRFARYGGGAATPIVDWTATPAIDRGAKAANKLGVSAKGSAFILSINDTQVATATDTAYASGRFGLWVGSNVTKNFTVVFDDLKAYQLP